MYKNELKRNSKLEEYTYLILWYMELNYELSYRCLHSSHKYFFVSKGSKIVEVFITVSSAVWFISAVC